MFRSARCWCACAGLALACASVQVFAQSGSDRMDGSSGMEGPDNGASARVGLGGGWRPEYRGADDYEATPLPLIDVRSGRVYFSTLDGLGWNVIDRGGVTVGPFVTYADGRDDTGAISKLDDIDGGAMAGVTAAWRQGSWRMEAEVATPVSGDLEGVRVRAGLRYRGHIGSRWIYAAGPRLTWGNGAWNDALFSVSSSESARSGLPAYDADGSYYAADVSARLSYRITSSWSITGLARVGRIFGDASDSPIVDDAGDATQALGGVLIGYRF